MGALDGKVAVVVGATSGIGACIAERFVAEGAVVVAAGRRTQAGEELAARLGPRAAFVRADVTVESDVAGLVAHALDRFGRVDCMVNNAGEGGAVGSILTADVDRFMQTMRVHVGGVLAGMKHAAAAMQRQQAGSIVNVASIGGRVAGWTAPDYSAAKAAILHLTRCAAVELAAAGIRVNSISPGPTLTGIFAKAAGREASEADRTVDLLAPVFAARLEQWQPLPHVARPADIAPAAVWLASDASAFVTGQDLAVDGGITAGRPISVAAAERRAIAEALAAGGNAGRPAAPAQPGIPTNV
jgi:NAD(P)-dependent dehydrogenase (short-subunit alcohol dehydrogenase family)